MTEKEIQLLGFTKEYGEDFYYYVYDVADGLSFISNDGDLREEDEWYIEFFDTTPAIRFTDFAKMQALLNLLEKHRV